MLPLNADIGAVRRWQICCGCGQLLDLSQYESRSCNISNDAGWMEEVSKVTPVETNRQTFLWIGLGFHLAGQRHPSTKNSISPADLFFSCFHYAINLYASISFATEKIAPVKIVITKVETLTLEAAKAIAEACEDKARSMKIPMNIAVDDNATHLLHFC